MGQLGQGQEGRQDSGWALCAVDGKVIMNKELLVMLGGCHMQWEVGESK